MTLGRVAPDALRLASLRLPPTPRMAQRTPCGASGAGSDNELWLCDEPACEHVPHAHPPSALQGARPKPVSASNAVRSCHVHAARLARALARGVFNENRGFSAVSSA